MAELSLYQMTGNPFLQTLPKARAAAAPQPQQPPLTPQEVEEAKALGILPPVGPATPPPTNLGQFFPSQTGAGRVATDATVGIGRRPVPTGTDYVPRVQLSPATAPASPLSQSLAARRAALNKELDVVSKPPDYTQLSQQIQARSADNMDNAYAAALAGLGPEAIQGFQPALLKQAMAAQQPMKVEGGFIDPSGRVMMDPGYQQQKKTEMLLTKLHQLDVLEQRVTSDQEKIAIAHERNMVLALIGQMRAEMGGGRGGASTWGFAPDGRRIVEDRNGNQYVINQNGSRELYTGIGTQKAPFEKNVQASQELSGRVMSADKLIALADANPEAFGLTPTVVSALPDMVQGRVMPKVLTPEQLQVRNQVLRQAAIEIHEIYGAALTMGEGHRASQWAIGKNDSDEMVINKLRAARDWAEQKRQALGQAANTVAGTRLGQTAQTPASQGSPDYAALAQAELRRRAEAARQAGGR